MLTVYFNPDCSKCSTTGCLLDERNIPFKKVEYLQTPPTYDELTLILKKLGINAADLIRKSEPVYKELYQDKTLTNDEYIHAMIENPILIERPIVIDGDYAFICRPPEKLLEFLKNR